MYDEHDLIDSPLNQTLTENGRRLEIHIYRMPNTGWTLEVVDDLNTSSMPNTGWTLEVVDDLNTSTVWDGGFATDQEALDTALADINSEGIEAFIARPLDH